MNVSNASNITVPKVFPSQVVYFDCDCRPSRVTTAELGLPSTALIHTSTKINPFADLPVSHVPEGAQVGIGAETGDAVGAEDGANVTGADVGGDGVD